MKNIDPILVVDHLKSNKLVTAGTLDERVKRLDEYYQQQGKERAMLIALCDTCGHYSDSGLDRCPFCGDSEPVATPRRVALPPIDEEGVFSGEDDREADTDPQGDTDTDADKDTDTKKSAGEAPRPNVRTITALELLPGKNKLSDFRVGDLDEVVGDIVRSTQMAAAQIFRVGKLLKLVQDLNLWRLRRDDSDNISYRGFCDWAESEVGLSRAYAIRLVQVAEEFTEEQLEKYGVTRLSFALRVPEEERPKFLRRAAKTPTKNLKPLVDGTTAPKKKGGTTAPGSPVKTQLEIELGMKSTPMFIRPTATKAVHEPTAPAKSITEDPWFTVEVGPDHWLSVRLFRDHEGEIHANYEFRQGEKLEKPPGTDVVK